MFDKLKLLFAGIWNFRTILSALDYKSFPGVTDAAALRVWLIDKAVTLYELAVKLTPNWNWDDVFVDEIRKILADDEAWPPIYWVISSGIVPIFSQAAKQTFLNALPQKLVAQCDCDCGCGSRKSGRIVKGDEQPKGNPLVIASVLSIVVSVLRLAQYFSGSEPEEIDPAVPEPHPNVIPDVDSITL